MVVDTGDVVLGSGDVTGGRFPDLLVRRADGTLLIIEADGRGGARHYPCADGFGNVVPVGVADVVGDGHAGLVAVTPAGGIVVYPHTGVFWPQDPAAAFGEPVLLGVCRGAADHSRV